MSILIEFIQIIGYVVFKLVPEILKGVFGIQESIDSTKDTITATILGVPVWVVATIGTVVTVGSVVVGIIIWWNKKH